MAQHRSDSIPARPARHPITVEEYDKMIEAGIFDEDAPLELINGAIVQTTPIGSRHLSSTDRLNMHFASRLSGRAIVRTGGSVHVGRYSEPQPDLVLLNYRDDFYEDHHAEIEDILLIVEVAHSSPAIDREVKGPLYRAEGILEYWIVNLVDQVIEVTRADEPRVVKVARRGETVAPMAFPDVVTPLDEILGSLPAE